MRPTLPRRMALAVETPLVVDELDLPAQTDRVVDRVHVGEHAVALGADPVGHVDAPLEERPLVVARQKLDVGHERVALARGERLAGLHRVDHEHELGQVEVPANDGVLDGVSLVGAYVAAVLAQDLDVAVEALALSLDVEALQALDNLAHGKPVLLVGLLLEDLLDVEGLELRLVVVRHWMPAASHAVLSDRTNSDHCTPERE